MLEHFSRRHHAGEISREGMSDQRSLGRQGGMNRVDQCSSGDAARLPLTRSSRREGLAGGWLAWPEGSVAGSVRQLDGPAHFYPPIASL